MNELRFWRIDAYDQNLQPAGAIVVASPTRDQALIDAEDRFGRHPQWSYSIRESATQNVLVEVGEERLRQNTKWGEQNHPDGTDPEVRISGQRMDRLRDDARERTDWLAENSAVTWSDILLEEVFEALAESDEAALRTELIQVAAVATQWVEAIDRRGASA
jgi:hypothetical protein